jgi:hypothetical protein
MHASLRNHQRTESRTRANKTWIVLVRRGARANAVVAPCASIQINGHCVPTVDQPALEQEFQQTLFDWRFGRSVVAASVFATVAP